MFIKPRVKIRYGLELELPFTFDENTPPASVEGEYVAEKSVSA